MVKEKSVLVNAYQPIISYDGLTHHKL